MEQVLRAQFRVLGPVEAVVAGQPLNIGHPRQRAVLACLLIDVSKVVAVDQLIDRVWGEDPPGTVRNILSGYVSRLRSAFCLAGAGDIVLSRQADGYLLAADDDDVDLWRFRQLLTKSGAARDDSEAAALLSAALGMWRGQALAGLSSPWLQAMRHALEQQRFRAVLDLNEIGLRQGRHGALLDELTEQAALRPADERLAGQVMLALCRCGRPADALRWFEQTRVRLADELGADPGPELQRLHEQILRSDPVLSSPAVIARAEAVTPRQLPADVSAFTGRDVELAELDRMLPDRPSHDGDWDGEPGGASAAATRASGASGPAVVISAVSGTAGVGKTALAVHWAHRVAGQFPDGQLYVNLRGYEPAEPVPAADALAGFLRALGVPGQDIPAQMDERAARYRSLLAGRRMLVLLDNARSADQVRPLLPGSCGCLALVTSRDLMGGLVARDGARRLDLDLLLPADAIRLLRALIGARVDAEPEAAATLAARCSRLPLALRVAAELAATRPEAPLADLAEELDDQQGRLDVLQIPDDVHSSVRAVFSWSYLQLQPEAACMFRRAGLHPGTSFEACAAAALSNTTSKNVSVLLQQLSRAHLIQPVGRGRYGMHDLLRSYARDLAAMQDPEGDLRAAVTRMLESYLFTAATALDILYPAESSRRPRIGRPDCAVPSLAGEPQARAWLDAERANLVATATLAAENGWPGYAGQLAATVFRYLDSGGYDLDAIALNQLARVAAAGTGDRSAEGQALTSLGTIEMRRGRHQDAAEHYREAGKLFQETGDKTGAARVLHNLGGIAMRHGQHERARQHFRQAVSLYRETGDKAAEAHTLANASHIDWLQGRYDHATDDLQRALALFRELGDRIGETHSLVNLGAVHVSQGRYDQGAAELEQARSLSRELGNRIFEAHALTELGIAMLRLGRHLQAVGYLTSALAMFRQIGERVGEIEALNGLGQSCQITGDPGGARTHYAAALAIATEIGEKYLQARAHDGLAVSYEAVGFLHQARCHWQQAATRYADLGAPEAAHIQTRLAAAKDA